MVLTKIISFHKIYHTTPNKRLCFKRHDSPRSIGEVISSDTVQFILMLLLSGAVITDLESERISNQLIIFGLVAGIIFQIANHGAIGILVFLGNILFPILILFPLFLIHAFGAGDIKLFAVVSGFVGVSFMPGLIAASFVTAAFYSWLKMVKNRNLCARICYLTSYIKEGIITKKWPAYYKKSEGKKNIVHFSVFILVGYCIKTLGVELI